jgi:hypothetical protein
MGERERGGSGDCIVFLFCCNFCVVVCLLLRKIPRPKNREGPNIVAELIQI